MTNDTFAPVRGLVAGPRSAQDGPGHAARAAPRRIAVATRARRERADRSGRDRAGEPAEGRRPVGGAAARELRGHAARPRARRDAARALRRRHPRLGHRRGRARGVRARLPSARRVRGVRARAPGLLHRRAGRGAVRLHRGRRPPAERHPRPCDRARRDRSREPVRCRARLARDRPKEVTARRARPERSSPSSTARRCSTSSAADAPPSSSPTTPTALTAAAAALAEALARAGSPKLRIETVNGQVGVRLRARPAAARGRLPRDAEGPAVRCQRVTPSTRPHAGSMRRWPDSSSPRADLRVPAFATVDLSGETVHSVASRGKHLLMRIGDVVLHSHLKMEGEWRVHRPGERWRRPGWQARVDRSRRRPRWPSASTSASSRCSRRAEEADRLDYLGPDLLGADWDADEAVRRIAVGARRADRRRARRAAQPGRPRQRLRQRAVLPARHPPDSTGRRGRRCRRSSTSRAGSSAPIAIASRARRPATTVGASASGSTRAAASRAVAAARASSTAGSVATTRAARHLVVPELPAMTRRRLGGRGRAG